MRRAGTSHNFVRNAYPLPRSDPRCEGLSWPAGMVERTTPVPQGPCPPVQGDSLLWFVFGGVDMGLRQHDAHATLCRAFRQCMALSATSENDTHPHHDTRMGSDQATHRKPSHEHHFKGHAVPSGAWHGEHGEYECPTTATCRLGQHTLTCLSLDRQPTS